MRINPCHACPLRNGCEEKKAIQAKASGTGARSISYDCDKLEKELRIGRRILIENVILSPGDYEMEYSRSWFKVKATITGRSGYYRFACVVDPGQITEEMTVEGIDINKIRFRRTMRHTRIVGFLDEPDAILCACGNVQIDGLCDTPGGLKKCDCCLHEGMVQSFA
jgi:hypothetical protein